MPGQKNSNRSKSKARGKVKPVTQKKACQLLPGGFAGTGPNGSFFEAPAHVDKSKKPGATSLTPVVEKFNVGSFLFGGALNPVSFVYSPNLVWLAIAVLNYFYIAPYNFDDVSLDNYGWVWRRLLTNTLIVFGYVSEPQHNFIFSQLWSSNPLFNDGYNWPGWILACDTLHFEFQ
jgi:hypothetical protein